MFSPSAVPLLARTRANKFANPKYSSLVHFSIGWLWHLAQLIDIPRKAWEVVSAIRRGSSWRTKKLAPPFSRVLPCAVTMLRTITSHGVLAAMLFLIQR